jgi:cobalt-precorrin 5A hydrolase
LKLAVIAVTKQGAEMACKTAELLKSTGTHEPVVYVPEKYSVSATEGMCRTYNEPLRSLIEEVFGQYQGIVCVMALGIVVRLIAPFIKEKTSDPAIVVMDETGRNVISVLSGHWGGANALTIQIANGLGVNPVITTATDINGLPAIEMIAKDNGWLIEPFELVKKVNTAIVNKETISVYTEVPLDMGLSEQFSIDDFDRYNPGCEYKESVVLVTNRSAENFPVGTLFLRPVNLCVGVGCRKGVSSEEVSEAVKKALNEAGRSVNSVRSLASVDIKSTEKGLLETTEKLNLSVEFFSRKAIEGFFRKAGNELIFSELVNEKIGVGGVCEPAAMLGAGENPRLIMPKTKYGRVTVAIAEGDLLL